MNLPGGSGSSGGICCQVICSSPVSTRPGKNPSPEGAGWKRSLERASFLCGWSLPFLNVFLYFSVCTAHLFPLFLRCRLRRLPQSGYHFGFTAILPEISLFYSDTPFSLSRSRQARSYGFVCRPMYVSSPCPIGTAAFGRTLAINSKTGSASYRNQYEWKTFSDEFPAKSNHISLCKFMEQLPLFPKVSVADSQIPSLPINSRIFLFLHAQKAYSWINYLLPSYPIKNIRIFLFLLYTKSVFVHFFMVTT